jgi:L-lactate utilization protein LutB
MIQGFIPILPGGKRHAREDGVKITGCGLCQTNVPCEYEIPRLIHKERKK